MHPKGGHSCTRLFVIFHLGQHMRFWYSSHQHAHEAQTSLNICTISLKSSVLAYIKHGILTLKAPIPTAADDKFCDIFSNFRKKKGTIFHENRLPAEILMKYHALFVIFEKWQNFILLSAANYRWPFMD